MKSSGLNEFALYVLNYRSVKNLTQQQMANFLGCTRETISRIENGKISPGKLLKIKIINLQKLFDKQE